MQLVLLNGVRSSIGRRPHSQRVLAVREADATLDKPVQTVAVKIVEGLRGVRHVIELEGRVSIPANVTLLKGITNLNETHRAVALLAET